MKPSLRNLFMKKLMRGRVVPTMPANVCLTDLRRDRLRRAILAEIRQQKQRPRQALLAGIEQLVDQIRLDPAVAGAPCTRSSACAAFPQSERANALSVGRSATRSPSNPAVRRAPTVERVRGGGRARRVGSDV